MPRRLSTREDKTANRGRAVERGYKPMPEHWKPPAKIPFHQASRPTQPQRTGEGRPESTSTDGAE